MQALEAMIALVKARERKKEPGAAAPNASLTLSNTMKHTENPSASSSWEFDEQSLDDRDYYRDHLGGVEVWGQLGE